MYTAKAASRGATFGPTLSRTNRPVLGPISLPYAFKPEGINPLDLSDPVDELAKATGFPTVRPVVAGLNIKLESETREEDVDSKSYMNDVLNLSVDIDADDQDDSIAVADPEVMAPGAGMLQEEETNVSSMRMAARQLVKSHDPVEVTSGEKHHWMVITVPEKPVAGENVVVYFNKNQSDAMRHSNRVQIQFGFNAWGLKPSSADRVELVPSAIPRDMGADFWSCEVKVPKEAYELNYIFSDGEFCYENNNNMDFATPVEGGISYDEWIDLKAERVAQEEKAKKEAALEAAAAEERERQTMALEKDKELGRNRALDLIAKYEHLMATSSTEYRSGGPEGPLRWIVVPKDVLSTTPTKATATAATGPVGAAAAASPNTPVEAPAAGSTYKLRYNLRAGPLHFLHLEPDQGITLHFGFNGWNAPGQVKLERAKPSPKDNVGEEWYEGEVSSPEWAAVMNLAFQFYEHSDNNEGMDYQSRLSLPKGLDFDTWSSGLAETFRQQEYEARVAAEEERRKRETARQEAKAKAQATVKAVARRKVRHVLYTVPESIAAGEEIEVCYNPRDTPLNGRENIYLIAGFNRWDHPRKLGPLKMTPPAKGEQVFKTRIKVPKDAYKVDMVFADVPGGNGTYDNMGGYDYHLPVDETLVREPSMHVVHISVEMAPIAKVGGLGDVVTALGRAVQEQGHLVEVVLPRYDFFLASPMLAGNMKYETEFDWGGCHIYVSTAIVEGLRVFFIEPTNGFFATSAPYGRNDDEMRFDFFCKAALEFLLRTGRQPDILHCHDWSTASVARNFWQDYQPYGLYNPKVVFTIHNLNYGQKKLADAAYFCQKFTTVSPTYAFETGGNPIIAPHHMKFMGIRNGIDQDLWDTENNQFLPMSYTSETVVEGKAAARQALRQRLGLTGWGDRFIVGVVSRLTSQKGVHLIKHAAFRTQERGGQFVLLGSAPDPKVQAEFNGLAASCDSQNAAFCFKYDEPLSHLIYAACDMICVPSMFEPCGLTQMIAMRFGSVPIVRHTGGLRDTVFDVDFDKARAAWDVYGSSDWERDQLDATNGFAFDGTDSGALDYALNRAIDAWYNDREWFRGLQKRIMEQDWSWNRPALDYIELYHGARKI